MKFSLQIHLVVRIQLMYFAWLRHTYLACFASSKFQNTVSCIAPGKSFVSIFQQSRMFDEWTSFTQHRKIIFVANAWVFVEKLSSENEHLQAEQRPQQYLMGWCIPWSLSPWWTQRLKLKRPLSSSNHHQNFPTWISCIRDPVGALDFPGTYVRGPLFFLKVPEHHALHRSQIIGHHCIQKLQRMNWMCFVRPTHGLSVCRQQSSCYAEMSIGR